MTMKKTVLFDKVKQVYMDNLYIAPNETATYRDFLAGRVYLVLYFFCIFSMVSQAFNIVNLISQGNESPPTSSTELYYIIYISLFVFSLLSFLFTKKYKNSKVSIYYISTFFVTFLTFWMLFLNLFEISLDSGRISALSTITGIYIFTLMSVTGVKYSMVIYAIIYTLYFIFTDLHEDTSYSLNVTISFIVAAFFYLLIHSYRLSEFRRKTKIGQLNEVIVHERESSEVKDEIIKMLVKNNKQAVFIISYSNSALTISEQWAKDNNYQQSYTSFKDFSASILRLFPSDRPIFSRALKSAFNHIEHEHVNFRHFNPETKEYQWHSASFMPQFNKSGNPDHLIVIVEEIQNQHLTLDLDDSENKIDKLTGILSPYYLKLSFDEMSKKLKKDDFVSMLIIDIDGLKFINNTHGQSVGDEVLSSVAHSLASQFRDSDIVCRLGGDEFCIILKTNTDPLAILKSKVQEVHDNTSKLSVLPDESYDLKITCTVGYSYLPAEQVKFEQLHKDASSSLHNAKQNRSNG